MAMLEIRNVQKTFRTYAKPGLFHRPGARKVASELPVLRGVDLTVEKGDVVAILGPSGSGKTTLLRCLNFLERPDTGCIRVNGETMWDAADPATQRESEVRKKRLHFGLVFQNFNLFPQYTALQNVTLLRQQSAEIVFTSYAGLRVPKSAVRVENGQTGVYILEGTLAKWKPITILHDTGESYVVTLDTSSTNNLWPGDELIINAKNLYDGKVVN